jgi:glycerol-3-phosphate acyltransferase PlsY
MSQIIPAFPVPYLFGALYWYSVFGWTQRKRLEPVSETGAWQQIGPVATVLAAILAIIGGLIAVAYSVTLAGVTGAAVAIFGVSLGARYPLFFRFQRGGSLAALAGALLAVNPLWPLLTLVLGALSYLITKSSFAAWTLAWVGLPLIGLALSQDLWLTLASTLSAVIWVLPLPKKPNARP